MQNWMWNIQGLLQTTGLCSNISLNIMHEYVSQLMGDREKACTNKAEHAD